MRPTILLLLVALATFTNSASAESPVHFWSYRAGGISTDVVTGAAVDEFGYVYITGQFNQSIDLGGGPLVSAGSNDIFLAKLSPDGKHVWSQRFGSTGNDYGKSVAIDGFGNVFVTGSFNGTVNFGGSNLVSFGGNDIFLAKYTPSGDHFASQRFGSNSATLADEGWGLAVDASNNVLLTGIVGGSAEMGGGPLPHAGDFDVVLVKYSNNFVHVWSRAFGSTGTDGGISVAVDASGNPAFIGHFSNSIDFGGGALTSAGQTDIFLVNYTAAGSHSWSKRFGSPNGDLGTGVAVDAAGNVVACGRFIGTVDFGGGGRTAAGSLDAFLAKYNSAGTHQWSQSLGGTGFDDGQRVAVDNLGNIILAGIFSGTASFGGDMLVSHGSNDAVVAKFDAGGVNLWSAGFGTPGLDNFSAVDVNSAREVVVAGRVEGGGIDLGGGELHVVGGPDIMVAEFGPDAGQPKITAIEDVANDQGRQVRITFTASGGDASGPAPQVEQYEAFRRIDPLPASSTRGLLLDDWEMVGAVSAHGENVYSMVVPTQADSTLENGLHESWFFIRAATTVPHRYFDSAAQAGYSVDNLAPSAPGGFIYTAGTLSWKESKAPDFDYFTVYGSASPTFDTDAVLLGHTIETNMNVAATPHAFYYVTATDFSGNEGDASRTNTASDVGTPKSYTLAVNAYPNPFNPATTIRYDVPSHGRVVVSVFDISGALISTLVNEDRDAGSYPVRWDGADAEGARLSSGVYFVRLEHSGAIKTRKLVLLK